MGADDIVSRILTDRAPAPAGHYSQATVAGGHVYISGQLPIRPDGVGLREGASHVTPGQSREGCPGPTMSRRTPAQEEDFEAQATQALENMLAILAAAGGTPQHLVRVTAYIVGVDNWPRFNATYAAMLPDVRPARTVVPVPELHYGFLVEIDAIAILAGGKEYVAAAVTKQDV